MKISMDRPSSWFDTHSFAETHIYCWSKQSWLLGKSQDNLIRQIYSLIFWGTILYAHIIRTFWRFLPRGFHLSGIVEYASAMILGWFEPQDSKKERLLELVAWIIGWGMINFVWMWILARTIIRSWLWATWKQLHCRWWNQWSFGRAMIKVQL